MPAICLTCHSEITRPEPKWRYFHKDGCCAKYREIRKTCTYCNFPAEQRNHIWPIMAREEKNTEGASRVARTGESVPVCKECNMLLWKHEFQTFNEAFKHLAKRYKSRARKTQKAEHLQKLQYLQTSALQNLYLTPPIPRRTYF